MENIYIIGFPLGGTDKVYDMVLDEIGHGDYEGVPKGEFLNVKGKKYSINMTHMDLMQKPRVEYWNSLYEYEKNKFLNEMEDSPYQYIYRDTTDPKIMIDFIKDRNAKTIIVIPDLEFVIKQLNKKKIFFPVNLIKGEENISDLKKAINVALDMFEELSSYDFVEIVNLDELLKNNVTIKNILQKIGISTTNA